MNWEDKELFVKNDKHCNVCYRPTKYPICPNCLLKLKYRGGGSYQVLPKDMFKSVIRYQQPLSVKIMGYSLSSKHRVPKEDRLGYGVTKEAIGESIKKIHYSVLEPISGCSKFQNVFEELYDEKMERRLLLYALLWHISYSKNLYRYESESHFKGAMTSHIISYVNRAYFRKHKEYSPITKKDIIYMPFEYHKKLYHNYTVSIAPMLLEV